MVKVTTESVAFGADGFPALTTSGPLPPVKSSPDRRSQRPRTHDHPVAGGVMGYASGSRGGTARSTGTGTASALLEPDTFDAAHFDAAKALKTGQGPYGMTMQTFQPSDKNAWKVQFPASPYSALAPQPPGRKAKGGPQRGASRGQPNPLLTSVNNLREYISFNPHKLDLSGSGSSRAKVPTRDFGTQTTRKPKTVAVQTGAQGDPLAKEFLEMLVELEDHRRCDIEEAERKNWDHLLDACDAGVAQLATGVCQDEEIQARKVIIDSALQYLKNIYNYERQIHAKLKPFDGLWSSEHKKRTAMQQQQDEAREKIRGLKQAEFDKQGAGWVEKVEASTRKVIATEEAMEYIRLLNTEVGEIRDMENRFFAGRAINLFLKRCIAKKEVNRRRTERYGIGWEQAEDGPYQRQVGQLGGRAATQAKLIQRAKKRSTVLASKVAFNQIQYEEEDLRQQIEDEEYEHQFDIPQLILQYLEVVMRHRAELDELENLEWVGRQGLVNNPGDGGGPLALARKGEAAMNLRMELTNLEDTEQKKRQHAELVEGLERDICATQRFEGLHRFWVAEDEAADRERIVVGSLELAERTARQLLLDEYAGDALALGTQLILEAEDALRWPIQELAMEPWMWDIYPYIRGRMLKDEIAAWDALQMWRVEEEEAITRDIVRREEEMNSRHHLTTIEQFQWAAGQGGPVMDESDTFAESFDAGGAMLSMMTEDSEVEGGTQRDWI
mmetsp:Transcript_46538/g.83218  ORF Transcript_46538/g.83218 Transcript_46538/m.83218 type:complete len:727 (-) Transcript_46538:742-2922(-)